MFPLDRYKVVALLDKLALAAGRGELPREVRRETLAVCEALRAELEAHRDQREVQEALSYVFDFDVDERLLRQLLADQPALVGKAAEWGWDDTEVREKLAELVCLKLVGIKWPTYGESARQDIAVNDLHRRVREAHDRWVAERG